MERVMLESVCADAAQYGDDDDDGVAVSLGVLLEVVVDDHVAAEDAVPLVDFEGGVSVTEGDITVVAVRL